MLDKKVINDLYASFIDQYDEETKKSIWENHSNKFRQFWNEKILSKDKKELNDAEIDEIIKILDTKAKGNTKHSQAVAAVMITQGAWRRMFKEIKSDKSLSSVINSIFTETDPSARASFINKLYEVNKGRKNNLTGQSANAINALLGAYDPFKNLCIVSLKDRTKLIQYLTSKTSTSFDDLSIGEKVVATSKSILDSLSSFGLTGSARTLSAFSYYPPFRVLWKTDSTEPPVDPPGTEEEVISSDKYLFYMESQLEDFLIENWDHTQLGKKYDLIEENDELVSQQYKTDIGRIDILAKDKESGRYVIIELKKDQTSDDTIGQLTRYMGWIEEHKSNDVPTKGVIIAAQYDKRLYYAAKKITDVELYLYKVDFHLEKFTKSI